MGERQKIVYFDKIYTGKKNNFLLSDKMEKIYELFKHKKYDNIEELELSSKHLYVSAIEKFDLGDEIDYPTGYGIKQYAYMINIASVDPSEEIKYADLDKNVDQRKIVVTDEDGNNESEANTNHIGPLLDTQIVIDPFRLVLASCRGTGRLTKWETKKFLKKLFGTNAMSFDVILNKKGMIDVKNMSSRTKFTYSIASPDHFSEFKDASVSERMDMKFVNHMSGTNFKIIVDSEDIPWKKLQSKITQLREQNDIKSIEVEGMDNGVEEKIDLLKNKLTSKGVILFDKVITIKDFFDMLKESYLNQYQFISSTFEIERKDGGE